MMVICSLAAVFFAGCGTPKTFQHAIYLQDSITEAEKKVNSNPAIIMPGDRLSINVTAINKEAAEAFNMSTTSASVGLAGSATPGITGYLVDSVGNIQLLQLGVIKAEGLTPGQLAANLQQQLVNYIKGPIVTVSISNFKINLFGEVTRAGTIVVPDGKINILEAIIQAGDLTLYGRRDNILVIREVNGKREFGRVDISSNRVFESPYFYLKQNDIVYAEPDKTKFISNDVITARNIRNFGFAVTILSTVILLVNLTKK